MLIVKGTSNIDPAWLDARQKGIGASEAAAVVGRNPYKTAKQLWIEKTTGQKQWVGPAAGIGSQLEGAILEIWEHETGHKAKHLGQTLYCKDDAPIMLASPDAIGDSEGAPDLIEIKATSQWWREPPEHVWIQVQQQLAVMEGKTAQVAALVRSTKFEVWDIQRDDAFIDELIRAEEEFWESVIWGQEPEAFTLTEKRLEGAELPKGMIPILEELRDVTETRRTLEKIEQGLKGQLKEWMQANEASSVVTNGQVAATLTPVHSQVLDTARLKEEMPDIAKQFTKTRESTLLSIKGI